MSWTSMFLVHDMINLLYWNISFYHKRFWSSFEFGRLVNLRNKAPIEHQRWVVFFILRGAEGEVLEKFLSFAPAGHKELCFMGDKI